MNQSGAMIIMGGILAGGLSRRMGGVDKCLISLHGTPLIQRVIDRIKPQVASITINANGDPERFGDTGLEVVGDIIQGYAGPLAGIHALIEYARRTDAAVTHVASVAADTPFFPQDFVKKCTDLAGGLNGESGRQNEAILLAKSNQNRHPAFGLWPVGIYHSLEEFLQIADTRKVMAFVQKHPHDFVEFANYEFNNQEIDPFFNINEPKDLKLAHTIFNPPQLTTNIGQ